MEYIFAGAGLSLFSRMNAPHVILRNRSTPQFAYNTPIYLIHVDRLTLRHFFILGHEVGTNKIEYELYKFMTQYLEWYLIRILATLDAFTPQPTNVVS